MNERQTEIETRFLRAVMDDTSGLRQPQIGDRYRSSIDVIEITYVSEPLCREGKSDRVVTFNVVEVLSPGDSSLGFRDVDQLFGDLNDESDPYVLVNEHKRLVPQCADTEYNNIVDELIREFEPINVQPVILNCEANMNDEIFYLDSLFLACALADRAEENSQRATVDELVSAKVIMRKRVPNRKDLDSERAFSVLIRSEGTKAWERRFSEVIASLGLSMKRLASLYKCVDAYNQHEEGLTTAKEFVYFLIDDMVKKASPATLEHLKVQRVEK